MPEFVSVSACAWLYYLGSCRDRTSININRPQRSYSEMRLISTGLFYFAVSFYIFLGSACAIGSEMYIACK